MKRREAIRNLTFAVAGVIFVPGCNFSRDAKETAGSFLSSKQQAILQAIVDTIIPGDELIPGAKILKVHEYIKIMIADCYRKEVQEIFLTGLEQVETCAKENFHNKFAELEQDARKEILVTLENTNEEAVRQFYSLVKGLSIQGFMTSEYVITNFSDYDMVPGPDYCCIEVGSSVNN